MSKMRIRFHFIFVILLTAQTVFAQVNAFGVKMNGNRVGKYTLFTEKSIESYQTFSSLEVELKSLHDTIYFLQKLIYNEDSSGLLKSISSEMVLKDSMNYFAYFNPDTTLKSNSPDTIIYRDSSILLGPEGIRLLCEKALDSIGATVCFRTYVPELREIKEINRAIVSRETENAKTYWIINESIEGQLLSTGWYDKNFRLYRLSSNSLEGKITLDPFKSVDSLKQFYYAPATIDPIKSNVYFPDPNNVNAVELFISTSDTTLNFTLADNSFNPVKEGNNIENDTISNFSWIGYTNNDSINSILKSISMQRDAPYSKLEKLHRLSKSLSTNSHYNNLKFMQFIEQIGMPSRLVKGFYYDRGFWHYGNWVEGGVDGEWIPFDVSSSFSINRSFRLMLSTGNMKNGTINFSPLPFSSKDNISIIVTEFLQYDKSIKLKKHNHESVEIKHNHYINHVIGLDFEIPRNYSMEPSKNGEILFLKNQWNETVVVDQILTDQKSVNEKIDSHLSNFTLKNKDDIKTGNKIKYRYLIGSERSAFGIKQGDSYLIFKITSEDPKDLIDFLLQKNLSINF
ncbi:MAG: transglutaminase domain-containing protein [Reichenbachiella sp.]